MPETQKTETQTEGSAPEAKVVSGLIDFPEPAAEVDPTKVAAIQTVEEVAQKAQKSEPVPLTPEQFAELHRHASNDDMKRDFVAKVLAARKPAPEPAPPPPVADRIRAQTEAEMSAGKKLVEAAEVRHANRPTPTREKWDGHTTPVFRPEDYVPDIRKAQGQVGARPVGA